MFENIVDFIDNRVIGEINNDFNTLKTKISDMWSGSAANSFDFSFDGIITSIDKIHESINKFNNVLANMAL